MATDWIWGLKYSRVKGDSGVLILGDWNKDGANKGMEERGEEHLLNTFYVSAPGSEKNQVWGKS